MRPFTRSILRGSLIAVCILGSSSGLRAQVQTQANANNNLKQLALAMINYSDQHNGLPPAAICDKEGKPILSWRVAILPFLEQGALHKQFKLDEPWDGPNNKKLIDRMPRVFLDSLSDKMNETNYRVFVGGGALFDLKQKTLLRQITDGTSNTFMIVETAESVPWTAPQEIEYSATKALPKLGVGRHVVFGVAFADGSVRRLPTTLPEAKLRAGITKAGGEVVNFDE
jgi:hypothetical protein